MHSKAHPEERHEPHRRSRWRLDQDAFAEDELADALVRGGVAGPECSHDRRNVLWKIERLVAGDPDLQFGLSGLGGFSVAEVVELMAEEAGFDPDPTALEGPVSIDPLRVLKACRAAGARLAHAAARRERVLLATGHPAGLPLLYMAVGELIEERGGELVTPCDGLEWREQGNHHRQIRYFHGLAVLTDRGSTRHTHAPGPMERMLQEARPDLVFADHGFAGAAIEAGIDTIAIADVNDPAPVVAKALGRAETVIVMDDNVQPESYWPCFQAIGSQFP